MVLVESTHHSAPWRGEIEMHCTSEVWTAFPPLHNSLFSAGAQYLSVDLDDAPAAVWPDTLSEPRGPLVWPGAPSLPGGQCCKTIADHLLLAVQVEQMSEHAIIQKIPSVCVVLLPCEQCGG